MNKLYSVHDHWTDISKKNDVDIESIDGVITGIKVNGEDYGGGGGESDFRTAEVTVSVNPDEGIYIDGAVEIIDNEMLPSAGFESGNYTLVLYKGSFEGVIEPPSGYRVSNATSTGGITITQSPLGEILVNITGDGALTVELTIS